MIPYCARFFKLDWVPMAISLDDVYRTAHLARIAIEPGEAAQVQAQLADIFRLIEQMQAVDTDGVEPMSHAQDLTLRLREDAVTECDQRARYLPLAPQPAAGLYLVPKVIE